MLCTSASTRQVLAYAVGGVGLLQPLRLRALVAAQRIQARTSACSCWSVSAAMVCACACRVATSASRASPAAPATTAATARARRNGAGPGGRRRCVGHGDRVGTKWAHHASGRRAGRHVGGREPARRRRPGHAAWHWRRPRSVRNHAPAPDVASRSLAATACARRSAASASAGSVASNCSSAAPLLSISHVGACRRTGP